jgi:hypothetical protein
MLRGIVKAVKTDVAVAKSAYEGLGIVASFFSFMQGRSTAFGIVFTVCGLIGFFKHYDLTSYSVFVGAVFTGVIGHSLKEDYFEMRRRKDSLSQSKESGTQQ